MTNNVSRKNGANKLNISALHAGDVTFEAIKRNGGQKILRTKKGARHRVVLIPRGTTL